VEWLLGFTLRARVEESNASTPLQMSYKYIVDKTVLAKRIFLWVCQCRLERTLVLVVFGVFSLEKGNSEGFFVAYVQPLRGTTLVSKVQNGVF